MTTVSIITMKERADEQREALKEKYKFDMMAKRDRVVAQWAAEIFGYSGEDAKRYIEEVIVADLEEPGDEDIIRKLIADFEYHGIPINRQEIEKQLLIAEENLKDQKS